MNLKSLEIKSEIDFWSRFRIIIKAWTQWTDLVKEAEMIDRKQLIQDLIIMTEPCTQFKRRPTIVFRAFNIYGHFGK